MLLKVLKAALVSVVSIVTYFISANKMMMMMLKQRQQLGLFRVLE